jgi:hypothetical protein
VLNYLVPDPMIWLRGPVPRIRTRDLLRFIPLAEDLPLFSSGTASVLSVYTTPYCWRYFATTSFGLPFLSAFSFFALRSAMFSSSSNA